MGGAPPNNTHISSTLTIATFMSAPVHRLDCRTGRLAAKCTQESSDIYTFCYSLGAWEGGIGRHTSANLIRGKRPRGIHRAPLNLPFSAPEIAPNRLKIRLKKARVHLLNDKGPFVTITVEQTKQARSKPILRWPHRWSSCAATRSSSSRCSPRCPSPAGSTTYPSARPAAGLPAVEGARDVRAGGGDALGGRRRTARPRTTSW